MPRAARTAGRPPRLCGVKTRRLLSLFLAALLLGAGVLLLSGALLRPGQVLADGATTSPRRAVPTVQPLPRRTAPASEPTVEAASEPTTRPSRRAAVLSETAKASVATSAPSEAASAAPPVTTLNPPLVAPASVAPAFADHLRTLLRTPAPGAHGRVAVTVLDPRGRTVLDGRGDEPVLPASTQKLLTAASALAVLEPEHRFVTRLKATSRPRRGVLRGDLVLVGSGDPTLATATYRAILPDRPATPLEALAHAVVARGIRVVRGRVIGDPSVFRHRAEPLGWPDFYVEAGISPKVSGLTVDGGRQLYTKAGRLESRPAARPAQHTAELLVRLLRERGVRVRGRASVQRESPAAPVAVGRVVSPPLRVLLAHTVTTSDNHMADAIFATVGTARGRPTWSGSARSARAALRPLGLPWEGVASFDGSGLSRRDRLTTRFLAHLQDRMGRTAFAPLWASLQAVAGESGTLRNRMDDTVAHGRVRGKTGYLRDTRALAAMATGGKRRRAAFAVIGNELDTKGQQAVQVRTDLVAIALVQRLRGCRLSAAPRRVDAPLPPGARRCRR